MIREIVFVLIILTAISLETNAQQKTWTLTGRIVDNSNYDPVPNVNIYVANSTIGTTSDMRGNFTIQGIPFETINVMFSCIGFESVRRQVIFKENKTVELSIKMKPIAYDLPTIDVVEEENDEWQFNYRIFEKQFLGSSGSYSVSKIENPFSINFVYSTDGTLTATCPTALKINNKLLGYKITYYLEQFVYNYPKIKFFGTAFFEDHLSEDADEAERQKQNRLKSYTGSLRHLLKSVSTSYLTEAPEIIAEDSVAYKDSLIARNIKKLNRQGFTVSATSSLPRDLSKPSTSFPINTDLLISKGISANELVLNFRNYLRVDFNSELIDSKYNLDSKIEHSWITLEYREAYIDLTSWSIDEYTIKTYGDWANKRVLDMLPLDYEPNLIPNDPNKIY